VLCVALMANLAIETWLRFLVWLVIGLVVYVGYGVRSSRATRGADATAGHRRGFLLGPPGNS
jgi:APA family basic amino acid/polyamine antiporter